MKHKHFYCWLILLGVSLPAFASDIVEVLPLTDKILMVHFDDGYVEHHKAGQNGSNDKVFADPLNLNNAMAACSYFLFSLDDANYRLGKNPVDMGRKSKATEFAALCQAWDNGCINKDADYVYEHWVYLYLPTAMQKGKTYTLSLGGLAKNKSVVVFKYDETKLRSEAVHVNIIGYSPMAPAKYSYLYHWAGDKGPLDLTAYVGKPFTVADKNSGQAVFTGTVAFRKPTTTTETGQPGETPFNSFSATDVYECDFSSLTTPGEYVLSVDGIGCSFPFKVGSDAYNEPFYWTMKGLYQNRSGIELKAQHTDFPRKAPHNPALTPGFAGRLKYSSFRSFDLSSGDGGQADRAAIEANYKGTLENTFGWYQDAGDWDGYFSHTNVPALLLFLYEINPEAFKDSQLNIPESGNGLSDLLDEAAWLLRYFKRTKDEIVSKGWGTGGIAGARVFGDLWGADAPNNAGQGSWQDMARDWYVLGEDPWTTYKYAAMAAQMAHILESAGQTDPEGVNWRQEAIDAYSWAKANSSPADEPKKQDITLKHIRLYASASLYRLTGTQSYHDQFVADAAGTITGAALEEGNRELGYATWMYLLINNHPTDATLLANARAASNAGATEVLQTTAEKRATRWGGVFYFPMLVGQPTTPMVTLGAYGYATNRTTDPAKASEYLKYIYTTADYFLGTNPLNMCWISGVGERHPVGLFHLDWWYSGKDKVMQGIVPYGPWKVQDFGPLGPWNPNWAYSTTEGDPRMYPASVKRWPGHERWFDQRTSPLTSEFTIHQNTVVSAFVYGTLFAEGGGGATANGSITSIGSGLVGNYYPNKTLTGDPVLNRQEAVNFEWGLGSPASAVTADNFSVRWEGRVEAPVTGTYAFSTVSDDGVRLWVNGTQIVNNWTNHFPMVNTGSQTFDFVAGQKYDIKMEYYENTVGATAKLQWSYPGQTTQPIPQNRLYPPAPAASARLSGETKTTETTLHLHPNPASQAVQVNFTTAKAQTVIISVTDGAGRVVKRLTQPATAGLNQITVPVTVSNGLYMLRVQKDGKSETQKFIVEK